MAGCKYSHGIYTAVDAEGHRVTIAEAERHGRGYFCELCHARLNPRKGSVRIHHFGHEKGKRCDPWAQPMSEWHRAWQERFPEDSREVVMQRGDEAHRADVFLEDVGTVIEFQHSPLSAEEFAQRNEFYTAEGRSVIWLFDVSKAYGEGHFDVYDHASYDSDEDGEPVATSEGSLRWRWPSKALGGMTAEGLDRRRVRVFVQLGDTIDETPRPIALIEESEEGFGFCDVTFMGIEDFVALASARPEYESAPISDFQRGFLEHHPSDFAARVKENHVSSLVVLRRRGERRITVVLDMSDDAIKVLEDRMPALREHYDAVDVVMDLREWVEERHLVAEAVGCRGYTGDFYRGRNNPLLVLKIKEDSLQHMLAFPWRMSDLFRYRSFAVDWPEARVWVCVAWQRRVPSSLTWVPDGADEEWCWPFVAAPGTYISRAVRFDGEDRITLDARHTFQYATCLQDMSSDREIYIKACRYDKRHHEEPFVVESYARRVQLAGILGVKIPSRSRRG